MNIHRLKWNASGRKKKVQVVHEIQDLGMLSYRHYRHQVISTSSTGSPNKLYILVPGQDTQERASAGR